MDEVVSCSLTLAAYLLFMYCNWRMFYDNVASNRKGS